MNKKYSRNFYSPFWLAAVFAALMLGACKSSDVSISTSYAGNCETIASNTNDPLFDFQWGIDNTGQRVCATNSGQSGFDINLTTAQSSTNGAGINIGIIDDGIDLRQPDLVNNLGTYTNFLGNTARYLNGITSASDSHGTMVSGIAAAEGWNSIGIRGVAPSAKILGFNSLKAQSFGDSVFTQALSTSTIDVFNLSLGAGNGELISIGTSRTRDQNAWLSIADEQVLGISNGSTVTSARNNLGALYVQSAGNGFFSVGYGGLSVICVSEMLGTTIAQQKARQSSLLTCHNSNFEQFSTHPGVLSVTALAANGIKSSYSSAGSNVFLTAPGGEYGINYPAIVSTNIVSYSNCLSGRSEGFRILEFGDCDYVDQMNGTSAAAPFVTGVIALIMAENPNLTWRDIKKILINSATQVDSNQVLLRSLADSQVLRYDWQTNSAGHRFHNWYGFGLVNANTAISQARSYDNNSLLPRIEIENYLKIDINDTSIANGNITYPNQVAVAANTSDCTDDTFITCSSTATSVTITVPSTTSISTIEQIVFKVAVESSDSSEYSASNFLVEVSSPSNTPSILLNPGSDLWQIGLITSNFVETSRSGTVGLPMRFAANAFYGESPSGSWQFKIANFSSQTVALRHLEMVIYGH